MMVGATIVRIPAPGWKPEGYTPPVQRRSSSPSNDVYVYDAIEDAAILADLVGALLST